MMMRSDKRRSHRCRATRSRPLFWDSDSITHLLDRAGCAVSRNDRFMEPNLCGRRSLGCPTS
jgi:hypothetical protein